MGVLVPGQNHTSASSALIPSISLLNRDDGGVAVLKNEGGNQRDGHEPEYKKAKTEKDDDR